jgi:hypothetical protein
MASSGRNSHLTIDGTDVSSYCNDISVPEEISADEITTFGTDAKKYLSGLADGSVSLSGPYDVAMDTVWAGIRQATDDPTFAYGPLGSTAAMPRRTGIILGTSYEVSASVDGPVEFSMELQVSGGVTFDAFS